MKLFNHLFKSEQKLESYIQTNIITKDSLLIQIFIGDLDTKKLQNILEILSNKLPHANIIGSSTAGEISDGKMSEESILISFSVFNQTKLRTFYFPKADFNTGKYIAQELLKKDTKAVIAFSEALNEDSELFLNGFSSINHDIPIAGGNAGDNLTFEGTFVVHQNNIYFEGIVICLLDNEFLHIHNNYSLKWSPVGKEMLVTKALNNTIYEIDYTPIETIYKHYLGDNIIQNMPISAAAFPLLKIEENVEIARAIVAKGEDGGFVYAGHFKVGDKVRFTIGNIEEILSNASLLQKNILQNPTEATYIYSCSVRKIFLQEQLNYEFAMINDIAPTTGFFTYGEFYHTKLKTELLNITTTTLSLSEIDKKNKLSDTKQRKNNPTMLNSLVNLVNTSEKILQQYKSLLDTSSIVSKTDTEGFITYVNDEFCRISGYTSDELIGNTHSLIKHPDTKTAIFSDMWEKIKSKKIWYGTIKNTAKDGRTYYVKSVIMPILDEEKNIVEYIAARTDVTELIKKDKLIKKQYTDELTSLQNRSALFNKLATLSQENLTLILINIDRFSDINDYFGYDNGDKILKDFANILKQDHKDVFRISGDEFAIICTHDINTQIKNEIVEMIVNLENIEHKSLVNDNISLFLSCGVAYAPNTEVYKLAHMALKENKHSNDKVVFYNDNLNLSHQIKKNIQTISTIKNGIKKDNFVPVFQGIVDNKTRKITKYESLIRLKDSDSKLISPYFFLEHAKKAKLYTQLTMIMIKKSFKKFENEVYEFSINLSLQDIKSDQVVSVLIEHLEKYKCGSRVVLEIVESEGIENFDELLVFIKQMKRYGCKIAIDDFGTGYSNFSYLSKLNIDFIKIDGSLIKDINKDNSQLATVEAILHFAKKMNIKTIAEFVEDESIYDTLNTLGVDFSQGYLFSLPKEELL